jgi:hypothetical protein
MGVRLKSTMFLVSATAMTIASSPGQLDAVAPPFAMPKCSAAIATAPVRLPAADAAAAARPVAQVTHFDRGNVTVSATTTVDGAIQVEARTTDLVLQKTVRTGGSYTLQLESGSDAVAVDVAESAVTLRRGGRALTLTPDSGENDLVEVGRLLVDSKAVRVLRHLGAEFEASDNDTPAAAPLLMADAIIGTLSGDVGATRRAAKQLSRRAASQFRRVQRPTTCYYQWEQSILWAYMELEECVFISGLPRTWCSVRWTLQAESAWFSFIACSGFGF